MYYLSHEDWRYPSDSKIGKRYRAHALYTLVCRLSKIKPTLRKRLAEVSLAKQKLDRECNSFLMDMHLSGMGQAFYEETMEICGRIVDATAGLKIDTDVFIDTIVTRLHEEVMKKEDQSDFSILVDQRSVIGSTAARAIDLVARVTGAEAQSAVFNTLFSTSADAWCAMLTFKEDNITIYEFHSPNGQTKILDVGNKLLEAIFERIPSYFFFTPLNEVQQDSE